MGRVLTNNVQLLVAAEASLGTQPSSGWKVIEPTTIGKYGPTLTKLTRMPISKSRQHRKGALTDLDSSVEFECDVTYDHVMMFIEGLLFASAIGTTIFFPTAVTATGYTVASGGDLANDTLVFARGFAITGNNGLKVLAGTSTGVEIKAAGLTAEAAAPSGASVQVAGVRGATGDFEINASGNLKSTTFNWTTAVGAMLKVGQFCWIGYTAGHADHSFSNAANRGLARVTAKAAGEVSLDKKAQAFVTDDGAGREIYVLFGQFIRNVPVDDTDYLERTHHFELAYENLQVPGPGDEYEYAKGNFVNEIVFDMAVASKATMKCNFVGTDTDPPTTSRATGASTATPSRANSMYNTSVDFLRLRVTDYTETALTADFKSLSISIKNNVSPEKTLGTLGGRYINAGMLDVEANAQILFTDSDLLAAMRQNTTVTLEACLRNEDGAIVIDLPAMTIEGGDKEFPINQTVAISMKSMAFQDPRFGTSIMVSTFPHLPAA